MTDFSSIKSLYLANLSPLYERAEAEALFRWVMDEAKSTNRVEEAWFLMVLAELEKGKPLQQVFGHCPFFGLDLMVNEHVLIPRPETEELVDHIVRQHKGQSVRILDIGTGSGCIAIALKKSLPLAQVEAIDISDEALKVARANAQNHNLKVDFRLADALNLSPVDFGIYDIIVSNPPYIKQSEAEVMHPNVLDFEPHLALFVPDNDALIFYQRIADFALSRLQKSGKLYFEINQYLAEETVQMLEEKGFKAQLIKDINENFRFVSACII